MLNNNMESNNGSTFYNPNTSRNFVTTINTGLSGFQSFTCSEVLVINRTGQDVYLYDSGDTGDTNRLLILDDESIVIRGVSNSSSLSAKTATGSGDLYYRASKFSNYNQG
jgi:hypothetical protein